VTAPIAGLLFCTSAVAGALNAVAGGGSFITLPALIYAGVPAVSANATSTAAMWPGSLSSAWAYRRDLGDAGRWLTILSIVSLVGGLLGAMLLVRTSDTGFLRVLPWLMLVAATTFTFGSALTARTRAVPVLGAHDTHPAAWTVLLQLLTATYGGYFGGGMGIMMLAILAVTGMTNLHAMNGIKSLLAVAINGVALVAFIVNGSVAWTPGVVMIAGGIIGGYVGAAVARRMDGRHVWWIVAVIAWAMTVYFFVR
jgi:uncharacterized protein